MYSLEDNADWMSQHSDYLLNLADVMLNKNHPYAKGVFFAEKH